jgi:hypothetical protein
MNLQFLIAFSNRQSLAVQRERHKGREMNHTTRIIMCMIGIWILTCCLCFESGAQDRSYPERILLIENCDAYQKCLDACADLVRSFSKSEVPREDAASRIDKITREIKIVFQNNLPSPPEKPQYSPEGQIRGQLCENIYWWTLSKTLKRTTVPGSPSIDSQLDQEIPKRENFLKTWCPNVSIPAIE